jgi:hypothetical protein
MRFKICLITTLVLGCQPKPNPPLVIGPALQDGATRTGTPVPVSSAPVAAAEESALPRTDCDQRPTSIDKLLLSYNGLTPLDFRCPVSLSSLRAMLPNSVIVETPAPTEMGDPSARIFSVESNRAEQFRLEASGGRIWAIVVKSQSIKTDLGVTVGDSYQVATKALGRLVCDYVSHSKWDARCLPDGKADGLEITVTLKSKRQGDWTEDLPESNIGKVKEIRMWTNMDVELSSAETRRNEPQLY